MNTLIHHVVILPAVGSMVVLNGDANRDPFAQAFLLSDQITFLY